MAKRILVALLTICAVVSAGYRCDAPHGVVAALASASRVAALHVGEQAEPAPSLGHRPAEIAPAPRRLAEPPGKLASPAFVRAAPFVVAARACGAERAWAVARAPGSPPGRGRARLMVFLI